jgi:hypothetical protein
MQRMIEEMNKSWEQKLKEAAEKEKHTVDEAVLPDVRLLHLLFS